MRHVLGALIVLAIFTFPASGAVFQYSTAVKTEKGESEAFLWIPPQAEQVRGVVMAGMTLMERECVKDARIRQACADQQLAIVFLKCGLLAADTLARTVKLRPEDASVQHTLGEALLQLGRRDEALTTLKEAVRLDDESAPAWMTLGEAYLAQNLSRSAEDAFRKSIHLRPDPTAFARLGMAAYQNGRFQEAMGAAETALKMQPGMPYAHYVMGLALHRMGRKDQAEQIVEILRRSDPDLSRKLLEAIKGTPGTGEKK